MSATRSSSVGESPRRMGEIAEGMGVTDLS